RAKSGPPAAEASVDDLPRVLSRPPWMEKRKAAAESQPIAVAMIEMPVEMRWPEGMKEEWRSHSSWGDYHFRLGATDATVLERSNLKLDVSAAVASELDDADLRARLSAAAAKAA